jgi:hypothetical protein
MPDMPDNLPTEAIVKLISDKCDWLASAVNALNIELARHFGHPFLDTLHVPRYPEPNTVSDETPLPNNSGVAA